MSVLLWLEQRSSDVSIQGALIRSKVFVLVGSRVFLLLEVSTNFQASANLTTNGDSA